MKRERAAAYLDMSVSAFDGAVRERLAPQPVTVPKAGARWLRAELDTWLAEQAAASDGAPNPWDDA